MTAPTPDRKGSHGPRTAREVIAMLRDRALPSARLQRIAADRRWTAHGAIRRALVLHPNTPAVVARNLVPYLYWREMIEVCSAPHVAPMVRRQAELRLAGSLEEMAIGERMAIARRAPRALIPTLIASTDARVLMSLVDNGRLVEADIVKLATARNPTPAVLRRIAEHHRWTARRSVRLALCGNPRTPTAVALGIAHALHPRDLLALLREPTLPRVVRVAAERILDRRSPVARGTERPRA